MRNRELEHKKLDITPLVSKDKQMVQSYGIGQFNVSRIEFLGSIIVFPVRTVLWDVENFSQINLLKLKPIFAEEPKIELVLIGCGEKMQLLPPKLTADCREKGIILETMDTGAACRTYNVLISEGRRVAAGLLALR